MPKDESGPYYLFDADKGDFYGERATVLGCRRVLANLWNTNVNVIPDPEPVSDGGLLFTWSEAPLDAPEAMFALPVKHPSITVTTALTRAAEVSICDCDRQWLGGGAGWYDHSPGCAFRLAEAPPPE